MKETYSFIPNWNGRNCHLEIFETPFTRLGLQSMDFARKLKIKGIQSREAFSKAVDHLKDLKREQHLDFKKIGAFSLTAACLVALVSGDNSRVSNQEGLDDFSIIELSESDALAFTQPDGSHVSPVLQKAQHAFLRSVFHSKSDAFLHLLAVTESKSNRFYEDNSGIATAYGWNPTKNTKEFNLAVAKAIGLNSQQQKMIETISDNPLVQHIPKPLQSVVLSDWQVKRSATVMMNAYETEFLNVLKLKAREHNKNYDDAVNSYKKLPFNQQAVLLHMTYKVGAVQLQNYDNFFSRLFIYMNNPNSQNMKMVAKNFEYSYKTRKGNYVHDTRVEETHNEFFKDCFKPAEVSLQNTRCDLTAQFHADKNTKPHFTQARATKPKNREIHVAQQKNKNKMG